MSMATGKPVGRLSSLWQPRSMVTFPQHPRFLSQQSYFFDEKGNTAGDERSLSSSFEGKALLLIAFCLAPCACLLPG
jgi:hypothetical protein